MNKSDFDELTTTGKLPTPSGVALQIMELTRRDDVSLSELTRVVQSDPALAGRLIKFANSAMAGPRRPVVAVADGIHLLGMATVRQLSLSLSILEQNQSGACEGFGYQKYWSGSLARGIAANALCMRTRVAAPDEAFSCGLLAEVGTLALATLHPETYGELLAAHGGRTGPGLRDQERIRFRADHTELSVALLENWMLPRVFIGAISHHEEPSTAPFPEGSREALLTRLLHLARGIGEFCCASEASRPLLVQDLLFGAARIGIDADALAMLVDEVASEWRNWSAILDVTAMIVPAFSTIRATKTDEPGAAVHDSLRATETTPDLMRVLVVDSDPAALATLRQLLVEQGHEVTVAADGPQALQQAMATLPHMILCNSATPDLDGLALCRAIRETEKGRQIYFLLLSEADGHERLVEAFEAGADDFVAKPVAPRVLLARLRAGQRVVRLQQESARDSQDLRRFATELAAVNRQLLQAALTDPLTGLPNRRYGMERLEQEWAASSRNQRPLSVMMIDLDRFKRVNDTHGHDVGDMLLRQAAGLLRKAARAEDVICRIGGEEFLVISPDTALAATTRVGDRLRKAIAESPIMLGALRQAVTVSIGVAERTSAMSRYDELLKGADQMLYHAKRKGGNRVEAAGADHPLPASKAGPR
jgi:diguanylate cyclase (GGDEF)-like protein